MRGEDVDTVAYQTAKACVFGLVDICCTASREAPSSSVISGICSAVFQNVLTFFTSTFEGQNISQIGCREIQKLQGPTEIFYCLKQESADCNESPLQKLFKFRALSLLHIFFSSPKDLLDACFELLVTSGTDTIHHKGAEYFLNQLTSQFNDNEVTNSSSRISDGIPLCTDSAQCDRESKGSEDVNPVSIDDINLKKPLLISTNCFIGMVMLKCLHLSWKSNPYFACLFHFLFLVGDQISFTRFPIYVFLLKGTSSVLCTYFPMCFKS